MTKCLVEKNGFIIKASERIKDPQLRISWIFAGNRPRHG